jgi:WD40 repeat protein
MELGDTPIVIWDIAPKRERLRLLPKLRAVSSLAFAADTKTLISGLNDTTALVWDVSAVCRQILVAGRLLLDQNDLTSRRSAGTLGHGIETPKSASCKEVRCTSVDGRRSKIISCG